MTSGPLRYRSVLRASPKLIVLLHGEALGDRAVPAVLVAAGDDVDDAAHRIRAVQRGHRATHHFNALDRIQRRQVGELATTEVVRIQLAGVALATAVDQHQGVFGRQAAHGDGGAAVLVGGFQADVDALDVAQGVDQAGVGALAQLFAADHADAGRCVDYFLLEASGGDHHLVEGLGCAGSVAMGVGGSRDGGQHGAGQQMAGQGRTDTMALGHGRYLEGCKAARCRARSARGRAGMARSGAAEVKQAAASRCNRSGGHGVPCIRRAAAPGRVAGDAQAHRSRACLVWPTASANARRTEPTRREPDQVRYAASGWPAAVAAPVC